METGCQLVSGKPPAVVMGRTGSKLSPGANYQPELEQVTLLPSRPLCKVDARNRTHRVAVGAVRVAINMTGPTRGQGQRAPWRSSRPFPGQPAWCKGPL